MNEEDTEKVTTPVNPDILQRNQPCLVVISGFEIGHRYSLDRPKMIIGRSLKSDIILREQDVSRQHACIIIEDNNYIIKDLQSKNKTLINGKKSTSRILKEGDL